MSIFGGRQPGQPRYSGQLHNMSITESVFGTTLPIIIGTCRVHGKLLDYNGFLATQVSAGGGKGIFGGGKGNITEYSANVVIALAQGPCAALLSIWDQQGKLANQSGTTSYVVPSGGGSITPQTNPPIQHDLGVTQTTPYTVTANDYGSSGPVTYTGSQQTPMQSVAVATTQYEYQFSGGTYTFPAAAAGQTVTIQYSSQFSLFYFEVTQAAEIPLGAPYQVSSDNQPYFQQDYGVTFVDTGEPLSFVPGAPTASGEYSEDVGFYSFAAADAGRYVYIKYSYYSSDATLTNSSALNLTFFNGAQGQTPWSFFVSNYPSSAFGYSGICYVGANPMSMGESPVLPSYNYELIGQCIAPAQFDGDVTDAIKLLLTNPLCGVNFPNYGLADWSVAKAYLAANSFFISDDLTTQQAVSETIKNWLDAANAAPVWSGSALELIPYGDRTCVGNGYTYTPPPLAATLTVDDLLPFDDKATGESTEADPIQVERTAGRDAYNYMQAEWTNRENDYNTELTPEQNDAFIRAFGLRMEGSQSWHFITSHAVASWALNLRLKRSLYKRNTYKFNLGWNWSRLQLMDVVELPTGEPVRLTEINEDQHGKLSITAEQFTYGSGSATIYPKQTPNSYKPNISQALPGDTSAFIFEASPQSVLAQPNTVQIAVAGESPSWGGCIAYVSSDGTTYTLLDKIQSGNRTGLLSAPLPSSADPDTTDTLSVDTTTSGGELVTATAAEANSFVTLCAIVDKTGTMELVSYETATLTAANRYNLTTLRRGVYGTTIGAHTIGAEFAYIGTGGVYEYQYPAQYAGKLLYFKFASFNLVRGQQQDLSACKVYTFTIPGTTLQPPSSGLFSTVPANPLGAYTASSTQAYITCASFVAKLNSLSVACLPAGSFTSSAVAPGQTFFAYYIDLAFAGGAITPIITQSLTDFQGRVGYYYLGSISTPPYSGGGGSSIFYPSASQDTGAASTSSPASAYDGNPTTSASVIGTGTDDNLGDDASYDDICTWYGFANITPSGDTLYVSASFTKTLFHGTGGVSGKVEYSWDGGSTWTTLVLLTASTAQASYSIAVPSGTNIDEVQVRATAHAVSVYSGTGGPYSTSSTLADLEIFEISIH